LIKNNPECSALALHSFLPEFLRCEVRNPFGYSQLQVIETPNQVCTIILSDSTPTVIVGHTLNLTIDAVDPHPLDSLTISTLPWHCMLVTTTFSWLQFCG